MLAQHVAAYLNALPVAGFDYRPSSTGGNVFIDHHPDQPDLSVAVFGQPGLPPMDAGYGYDRQDVHMIVRGPAEGAGRLQAHSLAAAIRDAMAGAVGITLPAVGSLPALTVIGVTAAASGPVSMGTDDAGRPEYSVTLQVEVARPTSLRPLG